jgi:hypothetical protein
VLERSDNYTLLELSPGVDLPRSKLEAEFLLKRRYQLEERTQLLGYYLLLA